MTSTGRWALVVDDVPVNRKLAMAFFTKLGWNVAEASGGNAALEWLSSHSEVDLVLLYIQMPDLCGEEVCRRLRENPVFTALPVVAYTAHAMQVDIERFLANGFNNVLIKPISLQGLKDVIAGVCPD
jgi:CheY-like chemotaxis protein